MSWAILRTLDAFPRLNDAYAELDGQAHRVQRDTVRLGVAVDVQKKDGSRTLLVPNIKDANRARLRGLRARPSTSSWRKARKGTISPDDFLGTTISLTNPGTVGTTSSAPRLMPGQGAIVATGAIDYPAEYRAMAPRTLRLLGISKVMTVTSTYDHRIIQGAESGLFLARMEELLKGEDGFYERIFDDLGLPHRPVRWEIDTAPGLGGAAGQPRGGREAGPGPAAHPQLSRARPPRRRPRSPRLASARPTGPRPRHLRPDHLGPRPGVHHRTASPARTSATLREILEVLREPTAAPSASSTCTSPTPSARSGCRTRMESARNYPALDAASKRRILEKLVEAESFERFLHAKYVGHKRFSLEGAEALIPLLDRILNDAAARGRAGDRDGHGPPRPAERAGQHVGKPLAQIFSEFEGNVDPSSTQGSGDVKYHLGASGTHLADTGETMTVTLAPNPSHLEAVDPVVEGMVRAKQDAWATTSALARDPAPASTATRRSPARASWPRR